MVTGWLVGIGQASRGSGVRPFGCLAYPKIIHPVTKQANQAMPCIHLTRSQSQPGYVCFDPLSKKVFVSTHVRFVESEFPGLERTAEDYERVAPPTFTMEYQKRTADNAHPAAEPDEHLGTLGEDDEGVRASTATSPTAR